MELSYPMQSLVVDRTNACLSDMTYDDTSIFPLLRLAPNSEERLGPEARIGGRTKKILMKRLEQECTGRRGEKQV